MPKAKPLSSKKREPKGRPALAAVDANVMRPYDKILQNPLIKPRSEDSIRRMLRQPFLNRVMRSSDAYVPSDVLGTPSELSVQMSTPLHASMIDSSSAGSAKQPELSWDPATPSCGHGECPMDASTPTSSVHFQRAGGRIYFLGMKQVETKPLANPPPVNKLDSALPQFPEPDWSRPDLTYKAAVRWSWVDCPTETGVCKSFAGTSPPAGFMAVGNNGICYSYFDPRMNESGLVSPFRMAYYAHPRFYDSNWTVRHNCGNAWCLDWTHTDFINGDI